MRLIKAVVIAVVLTGCAPPTLQKVIDHYDLAKEWYQTANFDLAIEKCNHAILEDPNHVDAWILLGASHRSRAYLSMHADDKYQADSHFREALIALGRAHKLASGSRQSTVFYEFGLIFYERATTPSKIIPDEERRQLRDESIKSFKETLRLEPERSYVIHRYLGTMLVARGTETDIREAVDHYVQFLTIGRHSLKFKKDEFIRTEKMLVDDDKKMRLQNIQEHEEEIKSIEMLVLDLYLQLGGMLAIRNGKADLEQAVNYYGHFLNTSRQNLASEKEDLMRRDKSMTADEKNQKTLNIMEHEREIKSIELRVLELRDRLKKLQSSLPSRAVPSHL